MYKSIFATIKNASSFSSRKQHTHKKHTNTKETRTYTQTHTKPNQTKITQLLNLRINWPTMFISWPIFKKNYK